MWKPTATQQQITALQELRKQALTDVGKAHSASDWLRNPRTAGRYRGRSAALEVDRAAAAAHLARQQQRLNELDEQLAKLVALANSE